MHPDTPVRELDAIIRRYGVTCLQLIPFEGGGYCVKLGSRAEPVDVGAGSLPEAIGKAFTELMGRLGRPSFNELLARSSLAPRPKRRRVRKVDGITARVENTVHMLLLAEIHRNDGVSDRQSACNLVHGPNGRYTDVAEDVTCGRCKRTSRYKDALAQS